MNINKYIIFYHNIHSIIINSGQIGGCRDESRVSEGDELDGINAEQ
jgi:hypothetical protein